MTPLELQVLRYIVRVYDTRAEELDAALAGAKPHRRDDLMPTIAEEWTRQAHAAGRAEGVVAGMSGLLLRQLRHRFGPLPPETERTISTADADALQRWSERLLEARSLDDLFAEPQPH